MPSPLRHFLRPLPLLAAGFALLLGALLVGESMHWIARSTELGSPLRELVYLSLALIVAAGLWLTGRECARYMRVRRIDALRAALARNGVLEPHLRRQLYSWLALLERSHGPELHEALVATRAALQRAHTVAAARASLGQHLLPTLDRRVEQEIRRAALRLGVVCGAVSIAALESLLALWFATRLVRRVAELHGARPGLVGTAHLVREVAAAALAADLSQHAADALSARVGSLAAAAGQGLTTATLLVRVGLWTQSVCRPMAQGRSSIGAFVARGAAQELGSCVRAGVTRAVAAMRSTGEAARP